VHERQGKNVWGVRKGGAGSERGCVREVLGLGELGQVEEQAWWGVINANTQRL